MDRFISQRLFFKKDLDKIKDKRVGVIGVGGLGSWIAEFLARIGIKELVIIDYDKVEEKNLDRQNYTYRDIGRFKIDALEDRIKSIDEKINVKKFREINIDILKDLDIFFDATDNMESKLLINEISVYLNKKYIFGSVAGDRGYVGIIDPSDFCLYDIFGNKEDVLYGSDTGVSQSTILFAISLMLNLFYDFSMEKINGSKIYHFNLKRYELYEIKFRKKNKCEICDMKNYKLLWKLKS